MLAFELKRTIRNKDIYVILILMLLLIITNLILERVYFGTQLDSNIRLNNLYNTFSQFIFLVFAPIFSGIISKDREQNSIYFYLNNNVSIIKYFISKLISYQLIISFIFFIQYTIYVLAFQIDLHKAIYVFLILLIDFYYLMSISFLLSSIMQKHSSATIMIIFTWFILTLVNIIPFSIMRGRIFLIDNNSYSSYIVSNFLNLFNKSINFKEAITVDNHILSELLLHNIIYTIIIYVFAYVILWKRYSSCKKISKIPLIY